MKYTKNGKGNRLARQGISFLLVFVLMMSVFAPGAVYATEGVPDGAPAVEPCIVCNQIDCGGHHCTCAVAPEDNGGHEAACPLNSGDDNSLTLGAENTEIPLVCDTCQGAHETGNCTKCPACLNEQADCICLPICETCQGEHETRDCPICDACGHEVCICSLKSIYLMNGAKLYEDYRNVEEEPKVIDQWNIAIKIVGEVITDDNGVKWHEFTYNNTLKNLFNDYKYVRVEDTTTIRCACTPADGVHQGDCGFVPAYDKAMADLTALEEEAGTLADGLDKEAEDYITQLEDLCDAFDVKVTAVMDAAFALYMDDILTDGEINSLSEKYDVIYEYLENQYGYKEGRIQLLGGTPGAKSGDKVTDNANGAIKFRLFNYSRDINYTAAGGTTLRSNSGYFTFRDSANFPSTDYPNLYLTVFDVDGFGKDHATVERVLSNGYPVLNLTRYADGTTRPDANNSEPEANRSLAYLFKSGDHAVTAYVPGNSILQKSGIRYYYNSANNAVDYDIANNVFRVRNYLERTQTTSGYPGYSDFMPFVYTDGGVIGKNAATNIDYHINNTYVGTVPTDYWFGMVMEVDFYMPKDGRVNGQDMTFKFSGDDDVWVFIDDVLVLDLGGTHGTVDGSINFATGEIKQYLSWNGGTEANTKGDTATSFPTTLRNCYTQAGRDPRADAYGNAWNGSNVTFADYSKHTLKFFYMERGGAVANCMLDFNLATLPAGGVSVLKEMTGDSVFTDVTSAEKYEFRLLKENGTGWTPVTNKAYTISGVNAGATDGEGKFKLSPNEMAVFGGLETGDQGIKYRVQEITGTNSELENLEYSGNSDATKWTVNKTEGYVEFTVLPADTGNHISHMTKFTNSLKTTDFSVTKNVTGNMGDWNKPFSFTAALYTKVDGTQINFPAPEADERFYTVSNGVAHFNLHHGQTHIFDDIPLGAYVVVAETDYTGEAAGGYTTKVKVDSGTESAALQTAFVTSLDANDHKVVFTNDKQAIIDTGVALDSLPYILILGSVAVAAVFLTLRRMNRYED